MAIHDNIVTIAEFIDFSLGDWLADNPTNDSLEDCYFHVVGQVTKATRGKCNPKMILDLIKWHREPLEKDGRFSLPC